MSPENYRYYAVDGVGHFHDAEWIVAQNDKDAIAQVEVMHPDATWELWHGTRLVEKLWSSRLLA